MTVQFDSAKAVQFLRRFHENRMIVLTSIVPDGITNTATFSSGTGEDSRMQSWIETRQGRQNIYHAVGSPREAPTKKMGKVDIQTVNWLHVDVDLRIDETPEEGLPRILAALKVFNPRPTAIVMSGNGYQGFWRLAETFLAGCNEANANEIERFNRQLEFELGGDHCFDISRIMRVPFTVNVPNAKKIKKGRQPVQAELVEFWDNAVYSLNQFTAAASLSAPEAGIRAGSTSETVKLSGNLRKLNMDELARLPDKCRVVIVQGNDPDQPDRTDRSQWVFYVCCEMLRNNYSHDDIAAVLMDKDFGISGHIYAQKRVDRYVIRQIERAEQAIVDPVLLEFNDQFVAIMNCGGKFRIFSLQNIDGHVVLSPMDAVTFQQAFANRKIQIGTDKEGNPKYIPAGKWWIEHPKRHQKKTLGFYPNQDLPDVYNLWRGFRVEQKKGDCQLYLDHVKDIICGGKQEYYEYLIRWMARAVQLPNKTGEVAVVMRGRMGTGKSMFVKLFGELFDRSHYVPISDSKHLVGNFNAHLLTCVVLYADEAFFAGDKRHSSNLKTLITEPMRPIERKGVDVMMAQNCTHILMSSNESWVVPAGQDERRYFVLDVSASKMQDADYFDALIEQMDNGGREALLWHLMHVDLKGWNHRDVPKTEALGEQKILSMSAEEAWWYNKLCDGRLSLNADTWERNVGFEDLCRDYLEYCRQYSISGRRLSPQLLLRFLNRVCPDGSPTESVRQGTLWVPGPDGKLRERKGRVNTLDFPTLEGCRDYFRALYGNAISWPHRTEHGRPAGRDRSCRPGQPALAGPASRPLPARPLGKP